VDKSVKDDLIPSEIKGYWKIAYYCGKFLANNIHRLLPDRLKMAVLAGFPLSRLIWPFIYKHSTGACFQKGLGTRGSGMGYREIRFPPGSPRSARKG
jgi:hypothetical protein